MLATIDRHVSFGFEGFLATEVKASLYSREKGVADPPLVAGFLAGLGGRDVTYHDIEEIAKQAWKWMKRGRIEEEIVWWDLKE